MENERYGCRHRKLTLLEFRAKYEQGDRSYEYLHGEAVTKSISTWIHGLLQRIIMELLSEAGYIAASEVELGIVSDAHPKPDVIAATGEIEDPYPTRAVDVVVEILSENDPMPYLLEKCQSYETWGFEYIYIVNPEGRQVFRWTGSALRLSSELTSLPVRRIRERLDRSLRRRK